MNRKIITEIISLLYVCLFLYTAIDKWSAYDVTREQMGMMPLLSPISGIVIWALPSVEIIIAMLMFVPRYRLNGLYLATGLMIFFTVYVIYMMLFYEHLPCSCGGFLQELSWSGHIIFNCSFIVAGIIAIFFIKNPHAKAQSGISAA